ncbi:phospholipid-transporting ATPase Dnf2p [[Candida] jaroonii]|uniref:Phospholipid-transporting ATPase Dnf2p n=1 Tax=[Candida] jaroonii TaxID=467808 RepID=A0ACA9Y301_9ASCO|nr:phospholipid-transporting ATPase Dnf2p [[Candida] jaroonii]
MSDKDPKSPFADQSYNSIHTFDEGNVQTPDNSFSDRNQKALKLNNRVLSDESFKTTKSTPENNSFDQSQYNDDDSLNSALPTPNLSTEQRFRPQSPLSPNYSRKPSLRFKLPNSSITDNQGHQGHNLKNAILEDEIFDFKQPNSPFNDNLKFQTVDFDEDDDTYYNEQEGMKRHRWGTTRNKQGKPKKENLGRSKTLKGILSPQGVMRSLSTRTNSKSNSKANSRTNSRANSRSNSIRGNTNSAIIASYDTSDEEDEVIEPVDPKDRKHETRTVVVNRQLPSDLLDPITGKASIIYPRNKIRTTKYTPLSFIPKNLSGQFLNNVANIYFLVLIILGYFQIFGVPNPVLSMVPLIVILTLTAIRDAIEDSRRTVTDLEVNNQPTHILADLGTNDNFHYENLNIADEKISLWRKFKKLNSRLLFRIIGASKRNLTKKGRQEKRQPQDETKARKSFESDISPRPSMGVETTSNILENPFRKSVNLHRTRNLKFGRNFWKNVKVGDLVRIYNNEEIPADVIILSTSEEDNGCYVETKNLDGETNLKVRQALKYGSDHKISKADDVLKQSFQIDSEGPHPNLYSYEGNFIYDDNEGKRVEESININNLLLRGCSLRNTKWVVGIVIFTGEDSKIMINAGITPTKQSRLSRELNYYVVINFVLLFIICLVSGIVNGFYYTKTGTSRDFFEFGTIGGTPAVNGIISFFVAVIIYQSIVPISLYITIELIKSAQAFFIFSDIGMYYERLDFPCTPKSWSISDDLGQIEYVFSDKTGTLTQNLMEFKKCTINGVSYGRAYTEALAGLRKRQGFDVESEANIENEFIAKDKVEMFDMLKEINPQNQYIEESSFVSSEFVKDLNSAKGDLQKKSNEHFMLALALCHSVLIEDDEKQPGKKLLKAQSPDEAALVGTARSLGFEFIGSTKQGILVNIQGETKEYQILNVLEFNSTRKRMSALIKIPGKSPNDEAKVLLICKGADSIIYNRLSKTDNDQNLLTTTSTHLEQFATEGLRTLCIAQREISWNQYLEWNKRHMEASSSLENREERMESVAESIERELILLGGTAIEDRLQDGVPDSISILAQAGIKLWVLTGDKVETAINIGFSCNLLGNDMELLVLKTDISQEDKAKYGIMDNSTGIKLMDSLISNYLKIFFNMEGSFEELEKAKGDHSPPNSKFGVIIDGDALKLVLNDKDIKQKFLLLCKNCKAVLCCRVSPSQKAGVVKLVKDTLDVMTLAIGDGSNDVAMIQAADVGIGIAGEEGRQAVMSSDYAIGQFRFLTRLLLTHGRWSYKRFSEMIPSFFYKNVINSIALFWYGLYDDFDGAYLFEYTYLMFYNLAFTSLPVIFLGILDQDVSPKVSLLVPELYRSGILRLEFPESKFWLYMIDGIYQSVISFFFPYIIYRTGFIDMGGLGLDHRYLLGVIVTCITVIACNLYILMHQYRWDWWSSLFIFLSIIIFFFWTGVWTSATYSAEFYKAASKMFGNLSFWACTLIGVLVCLLPRFFYDVLQAIYWPKDINIIRECVQKGDFDIYPEDYDPTDPNKIKVSQYSSDKIRDINESGTPTPPNDFEKSKLSEENLTQLNYNSSSTIQIPENEIDFNIKPTKANPENHLVNNRKSIIDIFKRKSQGKSYFDNNSFIDIYNHRNDTNDSLVKTEELELQDFDNNHKRASRISNENRRISSEYHRFSMNKVRTSLELPELTTVESLNRQLSKEG